MPFPFGPDFVADLDRLAKARDVASLNLVSEAHLVESGAFKFLKSGGAYGTGQKGWRVLPLIDVDGKRRFAVFTTPLTCEDIGEQVFEIKDGRIVRKIDEREDFGVRVQRWDVDLRLKTSAKRALLVTKTRFKAVAAASPTFQVRLSPHYKVRSVTDSGGKSVKYSQSGGTVCLPRPKAADFTYTLKYDGVVDLAGYAGAVTKEEVMLAEDYWCPMVARGPAPYSVTAHVPKNWAVIGQGEQVGERVGKDEKAVTFRMDVPVTYLSFSAGEFRHAASTKAGFTGHVWSRVLSQEAMQAQAEMIPDVFSFFGSAFGPSPFRHWGAVVTRLYGGGALEAYTFATYSPGWLPADEGHETAHTYFGGLLVNTYLNSFWNESFASWADSYYKRKSPRGNAAEKEVALVPTPFADPSYFAAPLAESGVDVGPVAGGLGYGKGSAVLFQMESEFPETSSWVKKWVQDRPVGRESEWPDFERACPPDARWFFDQWVRRTGYPRFSISEVRWEDGRLKGHVKFEGPAYRLTVDLLARNGDNDAVRPLLLSPQGLSESDFSVECRTKPELVAFDPWDKLMVERKGANPPRLEDFMGRAKAYASPKRADWAQMWLGRRASSARTTLPESLSGYVLVAGPEDVPAEILSLAERAGLRFEGGKAHYDGTVVELAHGAVGILLDMPQGGQCAWVMGRPAARPEFGHARLALMDRYGRLLRARTDPRTDGPLAFKL